MSLNGQVETPQPVIAKAVCTTLQHNGTRLVDLHHFGHDGLEDAMKGGIVCAVLEGHVDAVATTSVFPYVCQGTSPREKVVTILVKRDSHDTGFFFGRAGICGDE